MHCHWGQTAAKKERGHFEQRTSTQKNSTTLEVVGWNYSKVVYIASSKSFEPKRFVRPLSKVERQDIQEQQPN